MANRCEDYPCCEHTDDLGCNYTPDYDYIRAHLGCDHEAGIYECEDELTAKELEERGTADAAAAYDSWLYSYQEHNPYGPDEDGLRESDFI